MNIDKTIAKLELKHMLEELSDVADYPRHFSFANTHNWIKKNLSSFRSCMKELLPPSSRICFWVMRPIADGGKAKADLYELRDGYAEAKTLHAPDYDENEAENIQNIDEDEFFFMLRRTITYSLFFFPPWHYDAVENCPARTYDQLQEVSFTIKRKNFEFTELLMQVLGVNT